ncbi:hypothetical protein RN001_015419 [Aquatica leii]|uniref:Probable prefoldin subunit 6 n=1 Tax=Aquatica leii TaxID=1421715 RepID=A0AAN7SNI2_9COLE|nr:hypothetical protein RN001_015419 [Aquatica leii]
MDEVQKKIENEVISLKGTQKEYQKAISTRQQLDAQLNENKVVKEELNLLSDDRKVYKAIGPALIKMEIIEAKQNVAKRIDYINNEVKRFDDMILNLEKKQDSHREALQKLQQEKMKATIKT